MMIKRVMVSVISMIAILLLCAGGQAEENDGFLPSVVEVFGVDMPSLSNVLLREPTERRNEKDGSLHVIYQDVSEADFDRFNEYMEEYGCALSAYNLEGNRLTAEIGKDGAEFTLIYDNSMQMAEIVYPKGTLEDNEAALLALAWQVGNYITFGSYPQGKNGEVAPVEWQVLDRDGNRALLISKYALDCRQYNEVCTDITWEKCTLRSWLNWEFLNKCFSSEEQASIVTTNVTTDKNPSNSTNPGNATQDKVFLLSIPEAEKYFESDNDRMCGATAYAIMRGCYKSSNLQKDGQATCYWWLRSPGSDQDRAASVYIDGFVFDYGVADYGNHVSFVGGAVRPALWVDITKCSADASIAADNADVEAGDVITLGSYPQGESGKVAPVEWQVLERKGDQALLISKYALDCKRYNEVRTDITWEECTLRSWLNGEFLNKCFSSEERASIVTTNVPADKNPWCSTNPGNATQDKVFLLSIPEVEKYFTSDNDRMCVPSAYAKAQGCYTNSNYQKDGQATCYWWLRSPGYTQNSAAYVYYGGVDYFGYGVSYDNNAVRPALWVKIS